MLRAADRAGEIGAGAIQIFSDNPTAWRRHETPPEAEAFRLRLAELDVAPLAIHAAYLINLAGSDDNLFDLSVGMLRHELENAGAFGARFVNVHAGSHRGSGREAGLARIVEGLARAGEGLVLGRATTLAVIENSSGGGDAVAVTVEDLAELLDLCGARGLDEGVAFCLDTAHLWGAGYDVSDPDEIDRIVESFDRLIGLPRLAMIHLNDTVSALGSRHDRHTHLGEGRIGPRSMAHLLRHPDLAHVAFYLETPHMEHGYDAVNMARVYDLAFGRPLTPGPPLVVEVEEESPNPGVPEKG